LRAVKGRAAREVRFAPQVCFARAEKAIPQIEYALEGVGRRRRDSQSPLCRRKETVQAPVSPVQVAELK
jgi:hypothetical protein